MTWPRELGWAIHMDEAIVLLGRISTMMDTLIYWWPMLQEMGLRAEDLRTTATALSLLS